MGTAAEGSTANNNARTSISNGAAPGPKAHKKSSSAYARVLSRLGDDLPHPGHRPRARSHGDAGLISSVFKLADQQAARATAAEEASKRDVDSLLACARELNEGKVKAQMEVIGVRAELEMYKRQFAEAQREIRRAQEVVNGIDRARVEAEEGWARDRAQLRELETLRTLEAAREEGRRQGLREGIEHGRWMTWARITLEDQGAVFEEDDDDERTQPMSPRSRARASSRSITRARAPPSPPPPRASTPRRPSAPAPTSTLPPPPPPPKLQPPPPVQQPPTHSSAEISIHNLAAIAPRPPRTPSGLSHHSQSQSYHNPSILVVPPEGYFPLTGSDQLIFLPPPHELSQSSPKAAGGKAVHHAASVEFRSADRDWDRQRRRARSEARPRVQTPVPTTTTAATAATVQRRQGVEQVHAREPLTERGTNVEYHNHHKSDYHDEDPRPPPLRSPSPTASVASGTSTRISEYDILSPPEREPQSVSVAGKEKEKHARSASKGTHVSASGSGSDGVVRPASASASGGGQMRSASRNATGGAGRPASSASGRSVRPGQGQSALRNVLTAESDEALVTGPPVPRARVPSPRLGPRPRTPFPRIANAGGPRPPPPQTQSGSRSPPPPAPGGSPSGLLFSGATDNVPITPGNSGTQQTPPTPALQYTHTPLRTDMFYQYRDRSPSSSSVSPLGRDLVGESEFRAQRPAMQRSGTSGTLVGISVETPSQSASTATTHNSLDPVLLTPDHAVHHYHNHRNRTHQQQQHHQEEDQGQNSTLLSPLQPSHSPVIVVPELPPGFVPTSPGFVPLGLGMGMVSPGGGGGGKVGGGYTHGGGGEYGYGVSRGGYE